MAEQIEFLENSLTILNNAIMSREFPLNQSFIEFDIVSAQHVVIVNIPGRAPYKENTESYARGITLIATRIFGGE